ncbi:MAG: hypothetical protein QOE93_2236 [Actinomycetota bacterium]|nr:hypothetical protein [Actinomycetota bacterium]
MSTDPNRPRRALVTGATGYIASHLIPALARAGWDVLATGRRRDAPPLPDGVDYYSVNLVKDDPWVFSSLMERVTHVFHLAGASSSKSDQAEMESTNVVGTRRLLQAAKPWPIERFLHMSSTSVYGEEVLLPSPVPEDVERHPSRGYGKAKDGAERVVEEYAADGMATVVLRPVTVYGPGNVKLLASAILDVAVERFAGLDRIEVPATPIEQRLVHVDDVVAASIHLATAPDAAGRAFNVVLPTYPSSHQVAAMVADAFGLPIELVDSAETAGLPYESRLEAHSRMVEAGMDPAILLSEERFRFLRKANRNNRLSVDALLATGFEFTQTDLPASIARTIDWYRDHHWIL